MSAKQSHAQGGLNQRFVSRSLQFPFEAAMFFHQRSLASDFLVTRKPPCSANSLRHLDGAVGNTLFAGDLSNRLATGLGEPHCLSLQLLRIGLLDLLYDPCFPSGIVFSKILLLHESVSSSGFCDTT